MPPTIKHVIVPLPSVFRAVPSKYPPISVFEDIYQNPDDLELAFALEELTNDRIRNEVGDLNLLPKSEWVWGPGSSPLMAAFTHVGFRSRFSDGTFGVYYGAESIDTSIAETAYHKAKFFRATREPDQTLTMRIYVNRVKDLLVDVTSSEFDDLHNPDDYTLSIAFAMSMKKGNENGIFYRSVRRPLGLCVAVFRPRAMTIPAQSAHYEYRWSGKRQEFTDFVRLTQ